MWTEHNTIIEQHKKPEWKIIKIYNKEVLDKAQIANCQRNTVAVKKNMILIPDAKLNVYFQMF